MTNRKTTPPLSPRRSLPTDEASQTYARDAARQALQETAPPVDRDDRLELAAYLDAAAADRDAVEIEVDAMFCAEAMVTEAESEAHARMTAAYRGESLTRRGGK
jgi:hypothetical protein